MANFLTLLAQDLNRHFDGDFRDVCMIFPNKRAGLFLAEELSKLIKKPIWLPEIQTLNEYIESKTLLKTADTLALTLKVYKAYIDITGSSESFDEFYYWAGMLLSDFDDIDKYLGDAKKIFSNVVAYKDIENNFSYLTEEQRTIIQQFWACFQNENYSKEQTKFLKIWDKLSSVYDRFKTILKNDGLTYEGMNERYFCENITKFDHPKHIIFAGFNALNLCEERIFSYYRDNNIGLFYWDYDIYYTSESIQEAGLYMRNNLKKFPNELGIEHFNNLIHKEKDIEIISVPSSIGQTKIVSTILEETSVIPKTDIRQTAIILGDEQLLIPMLSSIPKNISKVNITMGYPANNSSIAAFITLICDLKQFTKHSKAKTYFYHKNVISLLNHRLLRQTDSLHISKLISDINKKNMVYITEDMLNFTPFIKRIFTNKSEKESIPQYLLSLLSDILRTQSELLSDIEKELIFGTYTQIQTIHSLFIQENINISDTLYLQIIKKILSNISIPFTGEPLDGLQIMGLMETRMLDFTNLVILSTNEGVLPKNTQSSSFIPYSLRVGFGLPTPEHQDALFAYYFYRLLQRAKNIKLLYTSGANGINANEVSRFISQLRYESGLKLKDSHFQNNIAPQESSSITIEKTDQAMETLKMFQSDNKRKLSPSALNTYIDCPIKFYFKYIVKLKETEELTEEIDARLIGNIFHQCAEQLYRTIPNGRITEEALNGILRNETLIDNTIKSAYNNIYNANIASLIDSRANELVLLAVKKSIIALLKYDKTLCPFDLLSMEKEFFVPINVEINGVSNQVYIGGIIDRVDYVDGAIRVVDYKTGSDMNTLKNMDEIFDNTTTFRNKAAFQTMLYCLMYDNIEPCEKPLVPSIYKAKNLFAKEFDYHLVCGKDSITNFRQYSKEFLLLLKPMLESLFNNTQPFTQTANIDTCKYCTYKRICVR